MNVNLQDHVRQLSYFARAFGDCIADVKAFRAGDRIYYNIDFSLLCPILFDRTPAGAKEFLFSTKDRMNRVLENVAATEHFGLVVSGATVIEFFDQLDHMYRSLPTLAERLPSLRDRYAISDENFLREALKTSGEIKRDLHDLSLLTQKGQDQRLRAPVNKLLKLFDTGALAGIGDVVDGDLVRKQTDSSLFEKFVAEHTQKRRAYDPRSIDDRLFHYRMDATNNCLTLAASKLIGVSTPFVTPTPINLDQCRTFGRLDRTPLFLLNLFQLKFTKQIGDELNFLEAAAREAVSLLEEIRSYQTLESVPNYTQLRLARFYRGPVALLDRGSHADEPSDEPQLEEILSLLSDQNRMKSAIKDAAQEIRDGAKLVELESVQFDLPYIEQFNFEDDPVIERIKKNLDVSLRQ